MRNRILRLGLLLLLVGTGCGPPTVIQDSFAGRFAVVTAPRDKLVFPPAAGETIVHVLPNGAEEGDSWWGEVTWSHWGCPRWSPDGSRLVIVDVPIPNSIGRGLLYLVGADGRNLTYLAEVDSCAAWAPDGIHLVFFFGNALYTMDINSLEKTILIEPVSGCSPDYAPDGASIVCGAEKEIFQVQLADKAITRLTAPCKECIFYRPRYSPDSEWILFLWHDFSDPVAIYRMRRDGSQVQRLYAGYDAAWSPDGSQIAFVALDDYSIWTMNPDGSNRRPLLRSPRWEYIWLDWGP